jgi:uncharacterized protein YndB with AHSA1/START domain
MTCVYEAPGGIAEGQAAALGDWRGPNGHTLPSGDRWVDDVYLEIVEPERIVFTGTLQAEAECLPETAGTVTFRRA